jgi:glycosyltransferase involved in cell wall biosynthesis
MKNVLARAGCPSEKVTVVGNLVDTSRFIPHARVIDHQRFIIGTHGDFDPRKNFQELLNAAYLLGDSSLEVRICGYVEPGWGWYMNNLKKLAKHLGVKTEITGYVDDIVRWYQDLDLYAQPSLSEAQCVALCQAMSCGLPALASDVEGARESLSEQFVYCVGSVSDLAEKISNIQNMTNVERRSIGCENRAVALEKFNSVKQAKKMLEVITTQ